MQDLPFLSILAALPKLSQFSTHRQGSALISALNTLPDGQITGVSINYGVQLGRYLNFEDIMLEFVGKFPKLQFLEVPSSYFDGIRVLACSILMC